MFSGLAAAIVMSLANSHLGPIPHPVSPVKVSLGSVQGESWMPPISPVSGVGRWIWAEGKPFAARFLKRLDCPRVPSSALVRITSECSYRLYVNGQIVARGPADVGRDYDIGPTGPWLYDVVDVRRWLRPGENMLAVQVVSRPLVQSEGSLGRPGLWLEADFDQIKIGTDSSWLAKSCPSLDLQPAGAGEPLHQKGEFLTMRDNAEDGWIVGQSRGWAPAILAPDAERPLLQSEIPAPMEANYPKVDYRRPHGGASLSGESPIISSNGGFAVRFDRVLSAHLVLEVEGGEGAVLNVMPNERDQSGYHRAVRLELGSGRQTFEVPFFDSFSTVNIEAVGVKSPIILRDVRAVFRSYPVHYRGEFESSDPALNEIWKVGRWSTQICMQTHHLDSPHHQEPISDPGDYFIEALISYNAFGEAGLARQDLRKYAQIIRDRKGRVFHTSYALLWLRMLVDYWMHTGDRALIEELAPTAFHLLEVWESWRGGNGLVSNPPNFMFIDWVEIEGFNLHHPPAVIGQGSLTAFYYRALEDGALLARLLGDPRRAESYRSRRSSVQESFQRELWSPAKRMFRDGKPGQSESPLGTWLPADKPIETFSNQVNILASAVGLVPAADAAKHIDAVMASGPENCQPYFMHYAFDALLQTGRYNQWATRQMRRWKVVSDSQTFPEMWDRGDLSHAWQCTPTYQLSARVLGISPQSPGFEHILIQPMVCDLEWAKGSVPTPRGDVKVDWSVKGGRFEISVLVPKGCQATLVMPNGSSHEVGKGRHRKSCLMAT